MSEHPDIALIRRGYEAFSRGDLDTLRQVIAADAVHFEPGSSPISGEHRGIEDILAFYGKLVSDSGGTLAVELEECFTDGTGTVVALHREIADRAGKHLNERGTITFTVKDGQSHDMRACHADLDVSNDFWS